MTGAMEQIKMPYRTYKQRYAGFKTLDDYDPTKKTITVVIPKRERLKPYDKTIWEKRGNAYHLIADSSKYVAFFGSAGIGQTFEAVWHEGKPYWTGRGGLWSNAHTKVFYDRNEAFEFLLAKL